jgi:hypothetical protein
MSARYRIAGIWTKKRRLEGAVLVLLEVRPDGVPDGIHHAALVQRDIERIGIDIDFRARFLLGLADNRRFIRGISGPACISGYGALRLLGLHDELLAMMERRETAILIKCSDRFATEIVGNTWRQTINLPHTLDLRTLQSEHGSTV